MKLMNRIEDNDNENKRTLMDLLEVNHNQSQEELHPVEFLKECNRHIKILEETLLFAEEYDQTLHITIKHQALHTYIIGTLHRFKGFQESITIRDNSNQLHTIAFLDIVDAYIIN